MTFVDRLEPRRFRYASKAGAVLAHLRYSLQNVVFLLGVSGLLNGGAGLWLPLVLFLGVILIGNSWIRLDLEEPENPPHAFHDVLLRATLPLLLANCLLLAYFFTDGDPLRLIAGLKWIGVDLDAARASTSLSDKLLGIVAQGFYWGMAQTAAHELSHRLHSRVDLALSNWIAAFALDPALKLHHPFCHHRYVGLPSDPGTARRGESLYCFAIRSTLGNAMFAARLEAARLRRMRRSPLSLRNRFLAAWAIALFYFGFCFAIAGWAGGLAFLGAGLIARVLFDSTAYVEHYGLFRRNGEGVSDRLSWDVYAFFSNSTLYNAARHMDHHLHPMRHCADLKLQPDAPRLNHSYIALVLLAFIPPLYRRLMQPHLDAWDRDFAEPAECASERDHSRGRLEPRLAA